MRPFEGKSPMKANLVVLLACVMVPALALAQEGQAPGNLNTITGVIVTGGRVEIVGSKKPNFTTFTMTDPPRLVIDISEAVFSGVKEEIAVGNGTITGIRTASYGSDESSIARVLIGYEREVETDIQASGNTLVVTTAGSGGTAVAERPGAAQGTAPAGTAPATTPGTTAEKAAVAAQTDRQQQEKAAAQSTAAAQDRQQQEKAVAQATAAAQADRQQQEKAAAQAAAAAQAEADAQRQAQARAEADRKAQEEAAKGAAQQAQQAEQRRLQEERAAKEAAAVAEKKRQQDEARATAEAKKQLASEEKARRESEAQAAAAEKKRQQDEARASAEEKKRLAAEEREAKLEEARAAAEDRRREQAEARQARVAQAERPRQAPAQGDSADVSSRSKVMTLVGFRPAPSGSRVFVRTNEPVSYNVTQGNKEVVLELENTRISESNNTRSLNTSFFDTAVVSVDADPGPSRTVRVAIKLKEQVQFETRQNGNEVSIEFQSPSRR
ncbi:AMIN domain-containing protein [Archangium violaceum]|uniref:AMIN domain-containing protein n=1 Tax=Archangium violaceum TaxID=83451 RepID=UPI002B2AEB30|nr:AMIN domain-containing protein [Archangium gephyra]